MKIVGAVLLALTAGACATAGGSAPAFNPQFNYTPPQEAKPGASDVTIALVSPSYSQGQLWTRMAPWTTFSRDMSGDFDKLLAARGFLVKGPFPAYDQMVFPDKEGSDLVLVPSLDVSVDLQNMSVAQVDLFTGNRRMKGAALLGGRVDLVLEESLTGTRMWVKDIPVPPKSVDWTMSKWIPKNDQVTQADIYQDPGFVNAIGPVLESLYDEVLKDAWAYLSPNEVKLVKAQSLPLRKKAAAIIHQPNRIPR